MLKNIPAVISPELLKILDEMGHGDEIVIGDANFPAVTCAKRLVRADGIGGEEMLDAIMKLFPLDKVVDKNCFVMAVKEGELIRFEDITDETDYEVYQLALIRGVNHELKANNTIIKILESGTAEIEYYRYPTRITDKNRAKYVFELSQDALEIMPYGIAADLLKSDISAEYGRIYAERYNDLKSMLDPRNHTGSIYIEGGVEI